MKRQETKYVKKDNDTTQTLTILVGETFEDTIVTEKQSIDEVTGEKFTHFILESQSTEELVTRSLEDLMEEVEETAAANEDYSTSEELELLDDLVILDPADDALELELMKD